MGRSWDHGARPKPTVCCPPRVPLQLVKKRQSSGSRVVALPARAVMRANVAAMSVAAVSGVPLPVPPPPHPFKPAAHVIAEACSRMDFAVSASVGRFGSSLKAQRSPLAPPSRCYCALSLGGGVILE